MIVIDTHILIWYLSDPKKLTKRAKDTIEKEKSSKTIFISSISIWEIYMLLKKERLKLSMDTDSWLEKVESLPFFQFAPVDNSIASKSVNLPGEFHGDPADRIIVATAREKGATLITADTRIQKYPHVKIIW